MRFFPFVILLFPLAVGGCLGNSPVDHRIRLIETPSGLVALPPECASWNEEGAGAALQNQPWPGHGCAEARNLAAQVAAPEDLVELRDLSPADAVVTSAAVARYRAGKTAPLIDAKAQAPSNVAKMEDNRMGGAGEE